MKTTSKAALARKLIDLGDTRSFNTLRKYSVEQLESMLHGAMPATLPVIELPQVEQVCHTYVESAHIPTDKELYAAALAPKLELVMLRDEPAPAPMNRWLALAMVPFMMLGRIIGM
jgi:hypothetical protein